MYNIHRKYMMIFFIVDCMTMVGSKRVAVAVASNARKMKIMKEEKLQALVLDGRVFFCSSLSFGMMIIGKREYKIKSLANICSWRIEE